MRFSWEKFTVVTKVNCNCGQVVAKVWPLSRGSELTNARRYRVLVRQTTESSPATGPAVRACLKHPLSPGEGPTLAGQ